MVQMKNLKITVFSTSLEVLPMPAMMKKLKQLAEIPMKVPKLWHVYIYYGIHQDMKMQLLVRLKYYNKLFRIERKIAKNNMFR